MNLTFADLVSRVVAQQTTDWLVPDSKFFSLGWTASLLCTDVRTMMDVVKHIVRMRFGIFALNKDTTVVR